MTTLRTGPVSIRINPRGLIVGTILTLTAATIAVITIGAGDYPLTPLQVLNTLAGNGSPIDTIVVTELRLPRTATALLAGTALGLSGAVFQTLLRNPLASPDIFGFTTGAATGALTAIVILGGGATTIATGAVTGGILTGILIYLLAWRGGVHGYRLVLTGIGVSAILTGVNGYLIIKAQIIDAARAVFWLAGSLNGRTWTDTAPLAVALLTLGPLITLTYSRALTIIDMGDDTAHALGIRVARVRLILLSAGLLLIATATAATGPIAFVALTAPQLATRLTRTPGPNLLPSALMGATLLTAADWAAQHAITGTQLPVGVVTGVLGGGYLAWLLMTERKAGRL